jgi:LysR family transcriptional regulator, regulator of abg operon
MYIKHLWYLHLVVSEGGFAAAAHAAGVSQPAITLAMQALEHEWGTPLFEKIGRHKQPTKIAVAAARRAAELYGSVATLMQEQITLEEWLRESISSTLRIGLAPAAALLYGPIIENAWRRWEPDGLLRIVSTSAPEMLYDLQQRHLDFVIVPRPRRFEIATLNCHVVHRSTPIVYARKGHPLASATSLAEIKYAGWAVAGRTGTAGTVIEEAHRVRKLPPPRILVQCADYMTLLNVVVNSDLLCVIPHPALLQIQRRSGIVPLQLREGLPQYEVSLFWHRLSGTASDGSLAAVINTLVNLSA